ncbi:hypothetical protein [Curvibacter phage PCA1]|nr:hypothetical protein [Curvibacter phage PCA1]
MTSRLLARMGQESVLRQEIVDPPRVVSIAHGVQFAGYGSESAAYRGDLVVSKSIATIPKEYAPRVGDRLVHPDGDYDLDVLHKDNGYTMQFILRDHVD